MCDTPLICYVMCIQIVIPQTLLEDRDLDNHHSHREFFYEYAAVQLGKINLYSKALLKMWVRDSCTHTSRFQLFQCRRRLTTQSLIRHLELFPT